MNGPAAATLLLMPLWMATAARAEVSISERKSEKETVVVLENEFVRLTVDVLHGGKVTGFVYKPLEREWLVSGQAMFIDHVWQQTWPGELYDVPYEYEITHRGPQQVTVKVWRSLQRKGMDSLIGVKVERSLSLSDASPVVTAKVAMQNPTDAVKTVGYWSQHIFRLGGMGDNYYVRPSTTGLAVGTFEYLDEGRKRERVGDEWVKAPTDGWTAALNPTTGEAAVFLMDYNDLRWLYNCIGNHTTEWYYDLLRMVPGSRWETEIRMLPLRGYRGVSFASREVVADVRLMRAAKGYQVAFSLGAGEKPLENVVLEARALSHPGRKVIAQEKVNFKSLGYLSEEYVSSSLLPEKSGSVVVEVSITGKGFAHRFEKHFGDYNRTDRLVAGIFDTGYELQPPRKEKTPLGRPAAVKRIPHEGFAAFEAQGQFSDAWRLEDALKLKGKYALTTGHFSSNVYGEQLDNFPAGYKGIMALDVVVLNNVSTNSLSPNDLALLIDYVKSGGGLLALGGWYAFGGGGYADSALADMLPVESGKPFDIQWHREGLPLTLTPSLSFRGRGQEEGHQKDPLANLDLSGNPSVFWLQELGAVKSNARIIATAGDKPFAVVGEHGRGRVACILAAPCGASTADRVLFCEWQQWPKLLGALLQWLSRG